MSSLVEQIAQFLVAKKMTLATCESITGGMLSSQFVQIEGASKFFKGGLVVYHPQAKIDLAQVKPSTIEHNGTISPITAQEMAQNTRKILHTDFAIATTGNASYEHNIENKPGGQFYIAIAFLDKTYCFHEKCDLIDRVAVQTKCVSLALYHLAQILKIIQQ